MSDEAFTFHARLRILVCKHCGASLRVEPAQSHVDCSFCGTQHVLEPRAPRARSGTVSEPERLELLFAQVEVDHSRGLGLSHMMRDGLHDPAHVEEALALWQAARRDLGRDEGACDAFFVMTKVL